LHFILETGSVARYNVARVRQSYADVVRCMDDASRRHHNPENQGEDEDMRAVLEETVDVEKEASKRDRKGRALAAMGHVARTDDGFEVTTAGRKRETLRVWRDAEGRVQCSCAEFQGSDEPRFRCEHILAVKYSLEPPVEEVSPIGALVPQVEEVVARQAVEAPGVGPFEPELPPVEHDLTAAVTPFARILARLKEPLPESVIRQRVGWTDRSGREHEVDYVEWHVVADILDAAAPDWSHAVRNIIQIGPFVAVTASITIAGVTREGVGTGEASDEKGIKKAEHDALKRAAVKFGVARELYRKDDGEPTAAGISPEQAVARTIADLVTPKQLVAIRAIANAVGIDAEKRSLELYNCKPEELTKKAASALIDDLKAGRDAEASPARRAS
jgi:hypothetical protein